jgi:hypothetical protein
MKDVRAVVVRAWVRGSVLTYAAASALAGRVRRAERGEGVVSLAIGVVIMAFLGVLLWVAFKATLGSATTNVNQQVAKLGQ